MSAMAGEKAADVRPTLMTLLREQAHRTPQRPVAVWGKEAPSYLEAYSLAGVLTRYFADVAGVTVGDAVLLSSPNSMGQFCALAAIQACGAASVLAVPGLPRESLARVLERKRPRVALVADPETCSCARAELPDAPVFSMGAPDVDAPSMGYMADQAIGLVDEVYLKVEDVAFDEKRDVEVAFVDADGCCCVRASQLARDAWALVEQKGLAEGAQVSIAASFSTRAGVTRLYAALSVGATIVLGA